MAFCRSIVLLGQTHLAANATSNGLTGRPTRGTRACQRRLCVGASVRVGTHVEGHIEYERVQLSLDWPDASLTVRLCSRSARAAGYSPRFQAFSPSANSVQPSSVAL